jgi:thiol-disulfide isomerase/thioredoxin
MNRTVNINGMLPNSSGGFFSKIQNAGSRFSSTTWIIIGVILLFIIVVIVHYYIYVLPKTNVTYNPNKEVVSQSDGKTAELLFFYADWCPHCKAAKPIWNDLKSEYQNKTINGYQVIFTEVDCSTETAETDQMMNKYNVEGYPTIKLLKDGQVIEYDAKPSKETLTQFLNTVL